MIDQQYTKILQFLARGEIGVAFPADRVRTMGGVVRVWEELHYLLPTQLDELANQLGGVAKTSSTKEKALARLHPLFVAASGYEVVINKLSLKPAAKAAPTKEKTMSKFATPAVKSEAPEVAVKHAKKKAAVKAKVATKVAKKVAKVPAKGQSASGQRGAREGTIASIIIAGIKAKKDPAKIIAEVKKVHPRAKTDERHVTWYKWKLGQK
jgi:hypothetical protein